MSPSTESPSRPTVPLRVGCQGCDDRPQAYFQATGYHRGFIWHFDAGQDAAWAATYEAHRDHHGSWALRLTL